MSPSRKSDTRRRSRSSHVTGRHATARARAIQRLDPRSRAHVATTIALTNIGWRVIELRPEFTDGRVALWCVTIERVDRVARMTVTSLDLDLALEELARYAAADALEER